MFETRHDSTKSTHCRDVGALSLEPPRRQGMQRNFTKRIPIVLGHFVNRTVLHITQGIEMINHIYSCQIITANGVVLRVWISVPPCFPSHRVHGSTVPVDCFKICRESTQESKCPKLPVCAKPVGMWNRLKTACPFLPKRRFKYNVPNTSCHVYNKDGDINPISYRTEKKTYSFLMMCKERHVSCKQPTRDFFFHVVISSF